MAKNNLSEINEQIRLIKKELGQLDFKKFSDGQLKSANEELSKLRRELNSVNSDIDYFGQSLKGSIQELQKANFSLGQSKKSCAAFWAFTPLTSINLKLSILAI